MLPLWIIDLNKNEEHSAEFKQRISNLPGTAENWCYTDFSEVDFENVDWFKSFLQELVEKGQTAIKGLKSVRPINECCMNVCVIGDATEEFTLKFFSSVAALVKKEKGRLIPGHIHQGINILGILYVPSDIHNADFEKRQSVLRCLKELDLQHRVNLAAGYDRVLLYQDTQRRTAKFYPLLNVEQRMDYLLQCLIHLYYICDETHPLLDANAADDFFFSLGVGSLYYDTNEQDENDLKLVGNNIFSTLKELGSIESFDQDVPFFNLELISVPSVFDFLKLELPDPIDLQSLGIDKPSPHPIEDLSSKRLMREFYRQYLIAFPTKLLGKIIEKIANSTHDYLQRLNDKMYEGTHGYYDKMNNLLRDRIHETIKTWVSPDVGCMSLIKRKIASFSKSLKNHRKSVEEETETTVWNNIAGEKVPKRYYDAFVEYHDCFKADENNTNAANCDNLKAQATAKLTQLLSHEPTLLSTIGRSFLAGIILVLALMPVLETISPAFINLGNIKNWSFIWAAVVFLVPFTIALIKHFHLQHRKKMIANRLIAYHLHDAYARVVNRAKNLVYWFYDRMICLCEEYDKRLDTIMQEKVVMDDSHEYQLVIPQTMFNQPVIGGYCCSEPLFPDSSMNRNHLSIGGSAVRVDKLTKVQQYTIVHNFSDIFIHLFDGVKVTDRVVRDKATQDITYNSDTDIEELRVIAWQKAKATFHTEFVDNVKSLIIPRPDKTIAQRLDILASSQDNERSFEIFSKFCEPNGEFVANDDKEFADIKTNSALMRDAFAKFVPYFSTQLQVSTDDVYRSFLFLTKWRTYDHISPNRVLPESELFDKEIFDKWEKPPKSSLLLFALIGNMSSEWYELFSQRALTDVPDHCKVYKDELERKK